MQLIRLSFDEIREMLRAGWREFFALAMYFKTFAPSWPERTKLYRAGRQLLLLVPAALIFLSSFAQAGTDQQISFPVVMLALIFAACIAVSWFVAGLILGAIPPLLRIARLFGLASFFACTAIVASAQMPPDMENGFKHWGSYDGSAIDSVNMLNGGGMLHAQLVPGFGQRGDLETAVFLSQNSKLWQVSCITNASGGIDCYWNSSNGGVVLQQAPGLGLSRTTDKNGSGTGTSTFSAFGYSITSPDGATHQLSPVPGTADPTGEATKFDAIDTTGYHLEMSVPDSNGVMSTATVIDRHGRQYVAVFGSTGGQCSSPMATNHLPSAGGYQPLIDDAPMGDQYCPQQAFAQQVTDRNGNHLSGSTNPFIGVDTLARAMPFTTGNSTTDYSGCVTSHTIASAYVLNYNAPDGTARSAKLCYAYINLQTAFGVSGIYELQNYPSPHTIQFSELVTIILADGSKWTFDYNSYGDLTFVGLPGGSITYAWTTIAFPSCDPNGGNVSRAVSTRTLNDNNGHSYTWSYSWGTPSNGSMANTATDAVGNDTVHVFTALNVRQAAVSTKHERSTTREPGPGGNCSSRWI